MLKKTFSFKILFMITVVSTIVAIGSATSVYLVARQGQIDSIRRKLVSAARAAAQFIKATDLAEVLASNSTNSVAWQAIAKDLNRIQSSDSEIRFMYVVAPTSETLSRGIVQFVVDPMIPEDSNQDGVIDPDEKPAEIGERYNASEVAPALLTGLKQPAFDSGVTKDKWGYFMSGYAPILDENGKSVGAMGVDISIDQLRKLRNSFIWQCLLVILAVLVTSTLVSSIIARHIAKPVSVLYQGMERLSQGDLDTRVNIHSNDEFERLADRFNSMVVGLRERKNLQGALDRYMSREVAELVMKQGDALATRRRRVTVLFCDLEQMTALSESLSPEQVATVLSVFHQHMIDIVFRNHGVVDKLLGDGLMAVFGAPIDVENQEECAIRCAVEMQKAMEKVRELSGFIDLRMGVGVHAGVVIAGNVGSDRIMSYTVIGDPVNVASRLENCARQYPSRIVTSQVVADTLKDKFIFESIGVIELRNRKDPVYAYQVVGERI
jgi:adenylate cyclase